ncbi:uncharacterized protein LOC133920912 [Phragmites australis]|uniref:uncharacterized protein LOC133920912 n=1 Tax=Phragmites australis TaxID=29695 RepID=UPI002D77CC3D|nr:uncharacterized protein LOC133920912 [Phragmites australis]
MGKKSGRNGRDKEEEGAKARAFVLKVAMHCHCNGCIDKIRGAVKGLALLPGIEAVDQSALESKGEVKLVAKADPEKLRQRLRKATRKHVDLILPKETKTDKADKDAAAAAAQALLPNSLQAQYGGQGAWANQLLPGAGGWNTRLGYGYGTAGAAQAYPWAAQQPDPYSAAYTAAGGAWGAYAYPPVHGHGGAWHAHGY